MTVRIGYGTDRHRLEPGENLVLGGVPLDVEVGTVGHSDGDAVVHALVDALIGAAGWGDIGEFFPPDDPRWEDVSSLELLSDVADRIRTEDYRLVNFDLTVRLAHVRLAEHRSTMCENCLDPFGDGAAGNVKFTTGESVGPVGRGEAVQAESVCLLER